MCKYEELIIIVVKHIPQYFLLFFTVYFLCSCVPSKVNKTNWKLLERKELDANKIIYWGTGYREPQDDFIRNSIAKKYGFEYKNFVGCMVSKGAHAQIEKHNKKIEKIVEKNYGIGWLDIYFKKVDTLSTIYTNIIIHIEKNVKLWDTLRPMIDTIKYSYAMHFLYETELKDKFIMKYCVADNFNNPTRDIYALEVWIPDYRLRIIRK